MSNTVLMPMFAFLDLTAQRKPIHVTGAAMSTFWAHGLGCKICTSLGTLNAEISAGGVIFVVKAIEVYNALRYCLLVFPTSSHAITLAGLLEQLKNLGTHIRVSEDNMEIGGGSAENRTVSMGGATCSGLHSCRPLSKKNAGNPHEPGRKWRGETPLW